MNRVVIIQLFYVRTFVRRRNRKNSKLFCGFRPLIISKTYLIVTKLFLIENRLKSMLNSCIIYDFSDEADRQKNKMISNF